MEQVKKATFVEVVVVTNEIFNILADFQIPMEDINNLMKGENVEDEINYYYEHQENEDNAGNEISYPIESYGAVVLYGIIESSDNSEKYEDIMKYCFDIMEKTEPIKVVK